MIRCNWSHWSTRSTVVTDLCRMSDQSIFVLEWRQAIRQFLNLSGAKKLAEGSYAEVYVAKLNSQKVVLKVIPFQETDTPSKDYPLVNDEEMASADVVLTEAMVSKALSDLSDGTNFNRAPNFVKLHKTFVFKGNYPKELLAAWNTYHITVGSESSPPSNEVRVRSHGVRVVIIDFNNSRIKKNGTVVHKDLSQDPCIFEGEGDPQYQVYRDMRIINGNDWSSYMPETNALWLHYLMDKLFSRFEGQLSNFAKKQRDEAVKNLAFPCNCSSAADFVRRSRSVFKALYDETTCQLIN
uniref:non-specific serine/threonine protein kinase n=1 Tax=Panagrellus redivivus TaxID=6233 RepID=A0A7E4URC8_PANRE